MFLYKHIIQGYMYKLRNGKIYTIRQIEVEDAENILKYKNQVVGESDFLTYGQGELRISIDDEINYIKKFKNSENSVFFLAQLDDEIIGTIGVMGGNRIRNQYVGNFGLSVAKKHWRNGVGKNLLETLILWSKENDILKKLNLDVYENNEEAIKLYKKLGFVHEGRRVASYCIKEKFFDSILMGMKV